MMDDLRAGEPGRGRQIVIAMPTIGRFLSRGREPETHERRRLKITAGDRPVYVVGDVHGCLDALIALEKRILQDAEKFPGDKLIVMLGDYIDRGPDSAGVIDHLTGKPPAGFERICLLGNHEAALLDYLDGGIDLVTWLGLGSDTTLASYGIDPHATEGLVGGGQRARSLLASGIPDGHIEFMRSLPILVETDRYVCVHAGLKPGVAIDKHSDHELIWSRPSGDDAAFAKWIIHGHTPTDAVRREGRRINLDTGIFHTGRLSALRIWKNKARILSNRD